MVLLYTHGMNTNWLWEWKWDRDLLKIEQKIFLAISSYQEKF